MSDASAGAVRELSHSKRLDNKRDIGGGWSFVCGCVELGCYWLVQA